MNIPVGVYPNRDASELRVVLKLFDMVFAAAQLEVKPVQHHRYRETDLHVVAQQDVFQAAEQLVGDFAEPAVGEHADAPGDERALCGDAQGAAETTAGKADHRHDVVMRRPAEGGAQDDVVALQQGVRGVGDDVVQEAAEGSHCIAPVVVAIVFAADKLRGMRSQVYVTKVGRYPRDSTV